MSPDLDAARWQVVRPRLVLLAAQGLDNQEIAASVRCPREVIAEWRRQFYEQGRTSLEYRAIR